MNPFDIWHIVRTTRKYTLNRYSSKSITHRIMRFLFADYRGMMIPLAIMLAMVYYLAPVWLHKWVFDFLILQAPAWIAGTATVYIFFRFVRRYVMEEKGLRGLLSPIVIGAFGISFFGSALVIFFATNAKWVQLYHDANFTEVETLPQVSTKLVRFTPAQVAGEEIVRRTQTSQFTPGKTRPIGSPTGVSYISPLIPQGMWNALTEHNRGFMYFHDGGKDASGQRVVHMETEDFLWGEGMEIFDDIHRRLLHKIGFFKSYPEIYYTPVYSEGGSINEVIGVVPYISYRFWWGIMVPKWGGVAIFHADGTIEDLTPEKAKLDPRLIETQRLFPEELAKDYVFAQRYDKGNNLLTKMFYGLVQREGKIEIPPMPGEDQMPFFLPMEDGSYQYMATVEPDGEAYSLMRIYLINTLTGERQMYRFDKPGRPRNLQGPRKVISYAKSLPSYVWVEGSGKDQSGTYRLVEPRPVTPEGKDHIFWMLSITPADYASVFATVFVDSATNEVHGPFLTREATFAWLRGEEVDIDQMIETGDTLTSVEKMCNGIETIWIDNCHDLRPPLGTTP
jgi:hypothetical protein